MFCCAFAAPPLLNLAIAPVSGLTRRMTAAAQTANTDRPAAPMPAQAPALGAQHAALLQRVGRDQDREAFVALFHYFAPRIKSYLLKNGADETTAEEVVQNTFVTVWEKAESFNPKKAAASTWIFTIARNKRIDALRRQKFVVPLEDEGPALDALTAQPVEDYADAATLEQLQQAMDKLPVEQSDLLRMAFFEDKSHHAISRETQLPLGTVKSRLRLAMDKLRHSLKSSTGAP